MEPVFKNRKWMWGVLAGILLSGFSALKLFSIMTDVAPKRANLLVITLDTLRYDHLNVYGYERATSPALSKLAKESFVLDKAFTVATNSGPAHATLLTGYYPAQHGLIDNGQRLNDETVTLAEGLQRNGYDTAGFVGYHALNEESGLNRGFRDFEFNPIASHDHDDKSLEEDLEGFGAVFNWLRDWAQAPERSPFFIWMHVQNIHESYDPPAPYNSMFGKTSSPQMLRDFDGKFNIRCANDLAKAWRADILPPSYKDEAIALYDGEIRLVDDQLGRLFEVLKSMGEYEDTVIVVVSDHGEVLFELYDNEFYKKGPGHTARYSDASIQVPLIIKPARFHSFKNKKTLSQLVSTIDLVPTLYDLLSLSVPADFPGESWVPAMQQPDTDQQDKMVFFHEIPDGVEYMGVRTTQWKFVIKKDEGMESSLLIDLVNDPEENQSSSSMKKAKEMRAILEGWKLEKQSTSQLRELSAEMRQALIEGGYLQ